MNKLSVIFCLVFLCKFSDTNSEPLRKLSRVGPFPSYPANLNPSYLNENENLNNYDYDYLNNVSLGRLLQDDNSLIQQTENLSSQVKVQIATRLIGLANRLQHAASILLDGTSRRRLHLRPHLSRHKSRHSYNNQPSRYNPINDDKRNSINSNNDQSTTPKPIIATPPNAENDQNSPKILNNDLSSSSAKPSILDQPLSSMLDKFPKSSELNLMNDRNIESDDAKKRRDLDDNGSTLIRNKRDIDVAVEHPIFKTVTKRQLLDVSGEVKSGYDSVIKLLKNYIDDPPIVPNKEQMSMKRSVQRAGEILENIESAKKIFLGIEEYVSRQYMENNLENRNQTDLLNYFDKIIRVEKSRIGQALNEYATQLAVNYNYRDFVDSVSSESSKEKKDELESSKDTHVSSSSNANEREREFQNDDDFHFERRREFERENVRNHHHASHYNEVTREDRIREAPIRPEIVVRRFYTPPKAKSHSRPTRRQSINIKPAYETSISAKEPIENDDDRGYEMIEP